MTGATTHARRRRAHTATPARRQRGLARRPDRRLARDPDDIGDALEGQLIPPSGHHTVSGIGEHRSQRDTVADQGGDLLQSDLSLGAKRHAVGDTRRLTTPGVVRPGLRQVQGIGGGNADRFVGQRDRDRHLTVLLLAEHAAVLTGHPDGVLPLLGEARVIHDPGGHHAVPLYDLEHEVPGGPQHGRVVPGGIGDEVVQRLVTRGHMPWVDACGHRLDALAVTGKAESRHIGSQRLSAIGMTDGLSQGLQVIPKAPLGRSGGGRHAGMMPQDRSSVS
jgi:hypothetical protein